MRHTFRLCLALAIYAALPAATAHAQSSYGYDSMVYNVPSGTTYWYSSGYTGVYTDPTTNTFAANNVAPFRAIAPYGQPPAGMTYGYSADPFARARTYAQPAPTTLAPARAPATVTQPARVVTPRRGLFGRLRGVR